MCQTRKHDGSGKKRPQRLPKQRLLLCSRVRSVVCHATPIGHAIFCIRAEHTSITRTLATFLNPPLLCSGMTELLSAMDTRACAVDSIAEALDADGQATANEFRTRVAESTLAKGAIGTDASSHTQTDTAAGGADEERHELDLAQVEVVPELDHDIRAAAASSEAAVEIAPRVGTPPTSSEDVAVVGAVGGAAERRSVALASDETSEQEQQERGHEEGHVGADGPADGLHAEQETGSTVSPAQSDGPERRGPAKASPTVRHLRIRGDTAVCLCDEAVALLTDLFSCYRMETLELPRTGTGQCSEGSDAPVPDEAAENELAEAAKMWAARTGITLCRR